MIESVTELKNQLKQVIVESLQSNNYLKNEVEQKENEKHDLLKDISLNIINIIDSFEQIEESIIEKEYSKIDEVNKTTSRYKTIQKKLLSLLQKHGITKIGYWTYNL